MVSLRQVFWTRAATKNQSAGNNRRAFAMQVINDVPVSFQTPRPFTRTATPRTWNWNADLVWKRSAQPRSSDSVDDGIVRGSAGEFEAVRPLFVSGAAWTATTGNAVGV